MIKLIVALGPNNLLGKGNKLPWHIKEELQFFKKMTLNSWLLMGRTTYEGIPNKLVDRSICVASSTKEVRGVDYQVSSTKEILDFIELFRSSKKTLWIIGGKKIYESFYKLADQIYVSYVKTTAKGDVYLDWDLSDYKKVAYHKAQDFTVYKYTKQGE